MCALPRILRIESPRVSGADGMQSEVGIVAYETRTATAFFTQFSWLDSPQA